MHSLKREKLRLACGAGTIACTYIYFLIFAEFAFLKVLNSQFSEEGILNLLMGAMGIAGILGSFTGAVLLKKLSSRKALHIGFVGCAAVAYFSPWLHNLYFFVTAAIGIGIFLGILTVSLASRLASLLSPQRFGLQIGLGTGTAYLICNLPPLFHANALEQAFVAGSAAVFGSLFAENLCRWETEDDYSHPKANPANYRSYGICLVIASFVALVWLDSAAFYIIQKTPALKTITWENDLRLWSNGVLHFLAALLSGFLIDYGFFYGVLTMAFAALAAGVLMLNCCASLASGFYVIGVSLYSTLLVAYPSLYKEVPGMISRRYRAALVYALGGWAASAMGIGMAKDLDYVPLWFIGIAGIIIIFGALLAQKVSRQGIAIGSITALAVFLMLPNKVLADEASAARGRMVYIEEGCIHCHSQYVRPGTKDEERWGPLQSISRMHSGTPPLIGNRRQGPDLLNVGIRRSAEWQRLHLMAPALLSPGSNMPSYGHLFRDERGEDLLSYLASLGLGSEQTRQAFIRNWNINPQTEAVSTDEAFELFSRRCSQCHGLFGLGDGPLTAHLQIRPRNLQSEAFRYIAENDDAALLRIIKFGIMGTSMPGQEYLSDSQILGLAQYLRDIRKDKK